MKKLVSALLLLTAAGAAAQEVPANTVNVGVDRHDFFYSGESKSRHVYKVRDGKKVWEFDDPEARGEISDIVPMTDGNILIAHQYGLKEIDPDGKTVWSIDAPEGCEIHTVQPIGLNHVVYIQNGDPLKAVVMEIPSLRVVRELTLPNPTPANVHGQVRNCCLTPDGTLLLAHMQMKRLMEFDSHGNKLNEWSFPGGCWGVRALDNGNFLVTGDKGQVREINRRGETVWEYKWEKSSRYPSVSTQKSHRLKNGNTIITNWHNEWRNPIDSANPPVQCIEVTPDKRIVWELCSWNEPLALGPATTFIPLDAAVDRCSLYFGDIRPTDPELQAPGAARPGGDGPHRAHQPR